MRKKKPKHNNDIFKKISTRLFPIPSFFEKQWNPFEYHTDVTDNLSIDISSSTKEATSSKSF